MINNKLISACYRKEEEVRVPSCALLDTSYDIVITHIGFYYTFKNSSGNQYLLPDGITNSKYNGAIKGNLKYEILQNDSGTDIPYNTTVATHGDNTKSITEFMGY